MSRSFLRAIALAVALVPATASAQLANDLHLGARVRVVESSGRTRVGTLTGYNSDSLTVLYPDSKGRPATTAFSDAARIDVSAGVSHPEGAARGALIGLAVGGVGGWAAARVSNGHDQLAMTVFSFVGAIGGAGLGAMFGAVTGIEHWKTLTMSKP
jgi:hypothetical protein